MNIFVDQAAEGVQNSQDEACGAAAFNNTNLPPKTGRHLPASMVAMLGTLRAKLP
jgi:hypothetical protein